MESTGKTRTKRTRVNFTIPQIQVLETIFSQTQYPDVTVVEALAQRLDLPVEKICTWFQNRRSKFRRESKRGHIEMMRKQMFQDDKVTSSSNSHKSVIKSVRESDKKKDCVRQEPTKPQSTRYNPHEVKPQSTRYSPYSKPSSNQSYSATTPCNSRWTNEQLYWQQTAAYQPSYNISGSNYVNQGGYNSTSHLPYNLTPQQMVSLYYNPALPGYPGIPTQSTGLSAMSSAVSSSHDPDYNTTSSTASSSHDLGYTTTSTGKHPVYTSRLPELPGCTTIMTGGASSSVSGSSANNESCSGSPTGQHGLSGSSSDQHGLSGSPSDQHGLSGSPSGQHGLSASPTGQHGLLGSTSCQHGQSGSPSGQHKLSVSPSGHIPYSGSPSTHVELSVLDYSSRCLYSDPAFTFMYNSYSDNMTA